MQEFVKKIQSIFPDCHVAVGYRDQADQHQAFMGKLSTFDWPNSPHNFNQQGIPQSHACDLFCLEIDGRASFLSKYYESIWKWYQANKDQFEFEYSWGGLYVHLKDFDHFQIRESLNG